MKKEKKILFLNEIYKVVDLKPKISPDCFKVHLFLSSWQKGRSNDKWHSERELQKCQMIIFPIHHIIKPWKKVFLLKLRSMSCHSRSGVGVGVWVWPKITLNRVCCCTFLPKNTQKRMNFVKNIQQGVKNRSKKCIVASEWP